MIDIHTAIYALNSNIVTIRGDVAYDNNEQEISYDMSAAQAKLTELQAVETTKEQEKTTAKNSALVKLTALGLTENELKALIGV